MEADGNKVLAHFTSMKPAVCVLDVMLPNKDGFSIAEEIRKLDADVLSFPYGKNPDRRPGERI